MTRGELKRAAKDQLRGRWLIPILAIAVASILSNLVSINSIGEIFGYNNVYLTISTYLLGGVFAVGVSSFSLKVVKYNKEPNFNDIFDGFNIYLKTLGLFLLVTIIIALGLLLLVVPGIIASLAFSQVFYILAEDDSKSISDCIRESTEMMKGYKWDLFVLQLSFLGWWLLAVFTFGIAGFWVAPYQEFTFTNYYLYIKENKTI